MDKYFLAGSVVGFGRLIMFQCSAPDPFCWKKFETVSYGVPN
jgi:hypothetical protein